MLALWRYEHSLYVCVLSSHYLHQFLMCPALAPCVPSNVTVAASCEEKGAIVSWAHSEVATSFHLTATARDGEVRTCNNSVNRCVLPDLRCGQLYSISVSASSENCSTQPSFPEDFRTGRENETFCSVEQDFNPMSRPQDTCQPGTRKTKCWPVRVACLTLCLPSQRPVSRPAWKWISSVRPTLPSCPGIPARAPRSTLVSPNPRVETCCAVTALAPPAPSKAWNVVLCIISLLKPLMAPASVRLIHLCWQGQVIIQSEMVNPVSSP